MAIAKMAKIIIASHRTQASELLEELQRGGICHILNAEEAILSRDFPELSASAERPRDLETLVNRLEKSIAFLKNYATAQKGLAGMLSPRTVIDEQSYNKVISDRKILKTIDKCEHLEASMEKTKGEIEHLQCTIEMLRQIGTYNSRSACLIVALKENAEAIQKLLRSAEFEAVSFEPMRGTVSRLINEHSEKLQQAQKQLKTQAENAAKLSENLLNLGILYDHYKNQLSREKAKTAAPTTEHTVIIEGWVKNHNYSRLEKIVKSFDATSLHKIEPAEDEDVPVEIDNNDAVRPFESITRLYGMPMPANIDPTVFLAPFFTIFFGLCLTDAGYGIVLVALLWFFLKKIQGDTKFMWMLFICSISTIVAGALTGGWFGDAVQAFMPECVDNARKSLILFDPMTQPMVFFALALGLGYIQIMFGLCIALGHNLRRKDKIAALCDQVTWLIMLNSLILFGLAKGQIIPKQLSALFGTTALIPAITILLFSEREGGWGNRIGMGVFNLFCTVFYLGDVLSYVRIMALGMVTGGFGMAVNISVKLLADLPVPYVGWILGALVFVGGHLLNIALSVLGSFVHSMRLQFVEFFPKFFEGGGKQFVPLSKEYKHIYVEKVKI
ncbi:MAG: V-type ATP synthase subunit I [Planctomycetota bacterium]|jgi:V/A-type H+-transporting ATPase subunit I